MENGDFVRCTSGDKAKLRRLESTGKHTAEFESARQVEPRVDKLLLQMIVLSKTHN